MVACLPFTHMGTFMYLTLQDRIAPFSCSEAKAMVARELGRPVEEVFSEWSDKPVAAASLAQVYKV